MDGPGKFSRVPSVPSIASPRKKRMGTKLEMEVADDVEDHMTKKRVKRECHLDDKDADYNPRFDK